MPDRKTNPCGASLLSFYHVAKIHLGQEERIEELRETHRLESASQI